MVNDMGMAKQSQLTILLGSVRRYIARRREAGAIAMAMGQINSHTFQGNNRLQRYICAPVIIAQHGIDRQIG